MLSRIAVTALVTFGIAGCTMAPDYQRPALPVPASWDNQQVEQSVIAPLAADIGWRDFFTDPDLQQLITIALQNNRDLRVAVLNIEKARAEYRVQRADLFPSLLVTGSGTHQQTAANMSSTGQETISRQYAANVGFSAYELDLFGRVQSLKNRALALYLATEETRRSVHISLIAEVANAYLTLLADLENLRLAEETLRGQESSYQLVKHRFDAGVISALDLHRAKTTIETARSDVAVYTSRFARDRSALALLLGAPIPETLAMRPTLAHTAIMPDLPAGLPSDLLQRRPDIMAAEYQLKAANANIGAARAAFFPRIALTANAGFGSTELSQLFDGGSNTWLFMPTLTLPIFTAGRNKANLDAAKVTKNIQIAQYEKAIQAAFKEVSDVLTQRKTLAEQLHAQQALSEAAEKTYVLAQFRYRQGIDSYLSVLDAQREAYSAQQNVITTTLSQLTNLVNLYKALGGGWIETTPVIASATAMAAPEETAQR